VRLLLSAGADPGLADEEGLTPLDVADEEVRELMERMVNRKAS